MRGDSVPCFGNFPIYQNFGALHSVRSGLISALGLKKNIYDGRKIAMLITNIYFLVKDGAKLPLTQSTDKSTMKLKTK